MQALRKLTWQETKLVTREPFAMLFTFAFPFIMLVVLTGVFGTDADAEMAQGFGGVAPSDYYLASYVAVVIGAIGLVVLPVHVAAYRERGVLRRFRAASIPAWNVLTAQLFVGLLTAILGGAVLLVAGRVLYDAAMPQYPWQAVLGFFVGTLGFLALGFFLGSFARNARAAQAIGMMLFFPMWLLSGAGPPPEVMSDAMQTTADLLPLTLVVRVLQDPWLGTDLSVGDIIALLVILVVAAVLSIRSFRKA